MSNKNTPYKATTNYPHDNTTTGCGCNGCKRCHETTAQLRSRHQFVVDTLQHVLDILDDVAVIEGEEDGNGWFDDDSCFDYNRMMLPPRTAFLPSADSTGQTIPCCINQTSTTQSPFSSESLVDLMIIQGSTGRQVQQGDRLQRNLQEEKEEEE